MKKTMILLCLAVTLIASTQELYAGRYFVPEMARWATPDPALRDKLPNELVKIQNGKLLSTSPYGYAFDNPLRYTDPDGKTPWDIVDIAAAALSIKDFIEKPTLTNAALAAVDVIGAAVPVVPSLGTFRHGAQLLSKVDDAVDLVRGLDKASDLGKLRSVGEGVWESAAGLRYGADPQFGNRVEHVLKHAIDDPARRGEHGVFDAGRTGALKVIDEAWSIIQKGGAGVSVTQQGKRTVYTVDMGKRIGYVGGQAGAAANRPAAQHLRLVVENGRDVITAFPVTP